MSMDQYITFGENMSYSNQYVPLSLIGPEFIFLGLRFQYEGLLETSYYYTDVYKSSNIYFYIYKISEDVIEIKIQNQDRIYTIDTDMSITEPNIQKFLDNLKLDEKKIKLALL